MDSLPLVSILIPNYNKAPYLRETLDSVLDQTYTNWECIIVDDHSTDESWNILEEYQAKDSRFKIFKRPEHLPKGGNACRNYAFELSKGEFVNWFDSDDIMLPDFVEKKAKFLIHNPKFDAIVTRMSVFENFQEYSPNWIPEFEDLKTDYLLLDIHFSTPGPMFSRKAIKGFSLFHERVKVGQEKEFHFRLIIGGVSFFISDEIVAKYRKSDNSIVHKYSRTEISFERYLFQFLICETIIYRTRVDKKLIPYTNKYLWKTFKLILNERKIRYLIQWIFLTSIFKFKVLKNKMYE